MHLISVRHEAQCWLLLLCMQSVVISLPWELLSADDLVLMKANTLET